MFLESIKIENGEIKNIALHQQRFDETRHFFFPKSPKIELEEVFNDLPSFDKNTIYKLRLIYNSKIHSFQIQPYQPKIIRSLKMIECNQIDYGYKYENRTLLNQLFEQKQDCDDVLIIKNNQITDTSYANIAFFDGKKWYTPKNCLLNGTFKKLLLQKKLIYEQNIFKNELFLFEKAKILNAMLEWEGSEIDIKMII
ncbi:MAG: hypothetical protein EAZ31_10640 [Cytophagia bacterium]|nr:MAG: hypothetical protein EAY69_06020 [Cytophagales bacterium]TAG38282.1 MAG: hypothetical protein EAZ31_10640 [Cytophagia bacterium]TAH29419.1 MAG: hypothetical protein EAZ06_06795 [Cytophagales bacterium]